MKYWTGYLTAAIFAAFTWALGRLGKALSQLLDAVYPYVTRSFQTVLAQWTGSLDFCLWQVIALAAVAVVLAVIVLMIVFRWNPIRWIGWMLAVCSIVFFLHTAVWGLNYYAGPLAEDIGLEPQDATLTDLEKATIYYRDQANALAKTVERGEDGLVRYDDFDTLAKRAGTGFYNLTYGKKKSVFAGSTVPVKKLAWSEMYTSMGITGVTMALTGESAVNPDIPPVSLPFTMCHEMAHRMSIASERDANFAAFLACSENPNSQFRYSAYFMAYRYCCNALSAIGADETSRMAARIRAGENQLLTTDLLDYNNFFASKQNEKATQAADKANDTYLTASGETQGVRSYSQVSDLLVDWYIQQVVMPSREEAEVDRFDPTEVDLSVTLPTEAPEAGEDG